MRTTGRFEYRYGEVVFHKLLKSNGTAGLYVNGKSASLAEWNRQINRFQAMSVKEQHPNPLIRFLEKLRRFTLIQFLRPSAQEVIADIGCESGFIAERIAPFCEKLYMVDIDPDLLARARTRIRADNVEFVVSSASDLKLPEDSVDTILASELLEHVPDECTALREMRRVLRPGGRAIISVPNDALIITLKRILLALGFGRFIKGLASGLAIGHLRVYSPSSLTKLCAAFGYVRRCRYSFPLPLNIYLEIAVDSREQP